jgi:hypothetical protein
VHVDGVQEHCRRVPFSGRLPHLSLSFLIYW